MDLTSSIPASMPATAATGLPAPEPSAPLPSDADLQAVIRRVLDEAGRSTGHPIRREELLLHLLNETEGLGQEALQAAGAKPERIRAELLRLMGHADEATRSREDRVPWPLSRWAVIAAGLSLIAYPLSLGPLLLLLEKFDLDRSAEGLLELFYFPIIWLYESVPWVKTFYDWYLNAIGLS